LKRRFQQNQNDCVFTVLSLVPTLGDQLLDAMNIEKDWAKLQESRKLEKIEARLRKEREIAESSKESIEETAPLDSSLGSLSTSVQLEEADHPLPAGILDKKEKHLLWEEIKIKSFTRSLTSIYTVTLLTLLTHIQLNLLGRLTYIWSVSVLNKNEPTIRLQQEGQEDVGFIHPQVERMFLSATWWLLHAGWKGLAAHVQEAVEEHVSSIPLKSTLNYQEAIALLDKIRHRIEYGEDGQPISYRAWMLPETKEQEAELMTGAGFEKEEIMQDGSLDRLLDETKDFIDSPDFNQVLKSCLDEVFQVFDQHAFVSALLPQQDEMPHMDNNEKRVSLANLLPTIGRQAHLVIAGNEYLNAFAYIKELQAFSALIYTHYDDQDA
ncbi:peroxin, partial [Rhizopus stolonifer]